MLNIIIYQYTEGNITTSTIVDISIRRSSKFFVKFLVLFLQKSLDKVK